MQKHSQRLQTLNPDSACECTGHEGQEGGAGLAKPCDPANGAGEQPGREHAPRVVHDDRVDGPEEDADEGHGDAAADEGGDEPDDEFEAGRMGVRLRSGGEVKGTHAMARIA